MTPRTRQFAAILIFSSIFTLTAAASALGSSSGQDWYCSDPQGHAQYEKHRRQHHDHNVDELVVLVEKIYADEGISAERRREMTLGLFTDYSAKLKMGTGD